MFESYLPRYALAILLVILTAGASADASLEGCKEYAKLGVPGTSGTLLCRTGYLLAHDPERKAPIWVAERLTHDKATATLARTNDFQPDPDLEEGERAELSDYKGSGYDRGHMAPAGDMRWDRQSMSEIFFLEYGSPGW